MEDIQKDFHLSTSLTYNIEDVIEKWKELSEEQREKIFKSIAWKMPGGAFMKTNNWMVEPIANSLKYISGELSIEDLDEKTLNRIAKAIEETDKN